MPSPYVRRRLGRRNTLGAGGVDGFVGGSLERFDGVKGVGAVVCDPELVGLKTEEREGRDFKRDCVGMVNRSAAGFDDGVEGRVGGTLMSYMRLVVFL